MRKAKKFILNTIILTITSVVIRSVNVSFTVYISGKIGAEGMGVYQLILSVYIFAITVACSGVGLTTTRLVSEELALNNFSGAKSAVKKCIFYSVCCGLIASLLLYINADFIVENWLHGKISIKPIYALCIGLPFVAISSCLNGYFTAVRRVIKSSSANIIEQFIKTAVTIYILSLFIPKGLDYACLALVLGGLIAEVLSSIYLYILYQFDKTRYNAQTNINPGLTKKMFRIAIPVAVSSYIRSALNTYKHIIIPIGLEKSGISCDLSIAQYGIIRGMVMPILMFPSALLAAFSSLLIPEISGNNVTKNQKSNQYIISRIFKITLLFAICVSGIFWFYSKELSMAIYKNLDSAKFIRILSPLIIIMYLDDIVDSILKGLDKQVSVVKINILDTVMCIILLHTLLPIYSIYGYIIVIFVSEIVNGLLSINKLIKTTNFELKFFLWIIAPILIIILSIIITQIFITSNLILNIIITIVIYLILLYIVGIVKNSDFKI